MSNVPIERELMGLVMLMRDWIRQGLRADEIAARLADPLSTGHELLERAAARKERGEAFLGISDGSSVVVAAEEPEVVKPTRKPRRRKRPVKVEVKNE